MTTFGLCVNGPAAGYLFHLPHGPLPGDIVEDDLPNGHGRRVSAVPGDPYDYRAEMLHPHICHPLRGPNHPTPANTDTSHPSYHLHFLEGGEGSFTGTLYYLPGGIRATPENWPQSATAEFVGSPASAEFLVVYLYCRWGDGAIEPPDLTVDAPVIQDGLRRAFAWMKWPWPEGGAR